MKLVRDYFTKNLFRSLLLAVIGVLMLVGGAAITETLKWLVFAALMVLCVLDLIVFIRENAKIPDGSDSIIYALLALTLALFIFKKWDNQFSDLAKIGFALVIVISGYYKLKIFILMANQKAKNCWAILLLGLTGAGFGIWVLFNMPEPCFLHLGLGFLYSALADIVTDVWFRIARKREEEAKEVAEKSVLDPAEK